MKFSVFQLSRCGGRPKNEDRMGYSYTHGAALFALADGMGGHPEGERAAELALQTISALFQRDARPLLTSPEDFLASACRVAHHRIVRYGAGRRLEDTPRTTIVACVIQQGQVWWAHCGDSRLYFVRDGVEVVRTRDHSYAEHSKVVPLKTVGEQATNNRSVLFTCLGSPSLPLVEVAGPAVLQARDRVLLCSDGLWSVLPEWQISFLFGRRGQPMSVVVPDLVERALAAGGPHGDNVTALGIEWEPVAETAATDSRIVTDSISAEVFASTIQSGVVGADEADDLDDAAIERSIAEINEAIRRTARRN